MSTMRAPLLLLFAAAATARPHHTPASFSPTQPDELADMPPDSASPTSEPKPHLKPGAVAGIVVGIVIGIALLGAGVFFLLRRYRRRQHPSPNHTRSDSGFAEPTGSHRELKSLEIPRMAQLKVYEPSLDADTGNWHIPSGQTLAPPPHGGTDPRDSLSPISPLSAVSEGSNSTMSSESTSQGFAPLSLRPIRTDIRRSAASRTSSLRTWETAAESPRGHITEPISAVGPPKEVVFPTVASTGSKETFGKRGHP